MPGTWIPASGSTTVTTLAIGELEILGDQWDPMDLGNDRVEMSAERVRRSLAAGIAFIHRRRPIDETVHG